MEDKVYYDLTIVESTDKRINRMIVWKCQCICGRIVYATKKQLHEGYVTSCGYHETNAMLNQSYHCLTPIYYDKKTNQFDCKCSCGKEHIMVKKYSLLNSRVKSCGHLLKTKDNVQKVDGVVVNCLTRRIPSNNKSGYKGVFQLKNNLWQAKISLKGKQYNLGRFKHKSEAIQARMEAEQRLFQPVIEKYKKQTRKGGDGMS